MAQQNFIQYAPRGSHFDWMIPASTEMGEATLGAFIAAIEKNLHNLAVGKSYKIADFRTSNIQLTVQAICLFITEHPNYEMSNDFQTITRLSE